MNNEERHNSTKTEKNHSCKCYGDGNEDDWERSISYIFLDILGYSLIFLDMLGYSWILKNIFCDMQWQWQWGWLGELYQRSISYIFLHVLELSLIFLDISWYSWIFLDNVEYSFWYSMTMAVRMTMGASSALNIIMVAGFSILGMLRYS